MATEMRPTSDGDRHTILAKAAAPAYGLVCRLGSLFGESTVRFHADKPAISIHGESENSGNAFERGKLVEKIGTLATFILFAPLLGMLILARSVNLLGIQPGGPLLVLAVTGVTAYGVWAALAVRGMPRLADRVSVIDHTTEPVDDCDDLKDRYLSGELTEAELEAETEARLE